MRQYVNYFILFHLVFIFHYYSFLKVYYNEVFKQLNLFITVRFNQLGFKVFIIIHKFLFLTKIFQYLINLFQFQHYLNHCEVIIAFKIVVIKVIID